MVTVPDITSTDLAVIRRHVEHAAGTAGVSQSRAGRFTLAVSEIASNAIKHGQAPRSVTIITHSDRVTVEVCDHGPGFDSAGHPFTRPGLDDPGGRGLWLAREWSDELKITSSTAGSTVLLTAVADSA